MINLNIQSEVILSILSFELILYKKYSKTISTLKRARSLMIFNSSFLNLSNSGSNLELALKSGLRK